MKPKIFFRGGLAFAVKRDSWWTKAISTPTGTPHSSCASRASSYHPSFSRKIAHTLSTSAGGLVAQAHSTSVGPSRSARSARVDLAGGWRSALCRGIAITRFDAAQKLGLVYDFYAKRLG